MSAIAVLVWVALLARAAWLIVHPPKRPRVPVV